MTIVSTYKGFSSINAHITRSLVLTDVALIKRDLLNLFYTYPGENRMRPLYGSNLRRIIFEQYQANTQDRTNIIDEVKRIVQSDPRATYLSASVTDFPYGIAIAVQLQFNPFVVVDTLIAQFNQDSDDIYGFSGTF